MLVDYPDSESDIQEAPIAKRRKLQALFKPESASPPPPPASFHSLYATNVRTTVADDPTLHAGRTRQIAHAEGNWPTHVYLEWAPSKEQCCTLESLISCCRSDFGDKESQIHSFLQSSLNVRQPLHISLSAPLTLTTEHKDNFAAAIKEEFDRCEARSFSVRPTHLEWVSNFDHSRSFLVLKLIQPENDDLNKLLHASNICARKFGQDLLYQQKNGKNSSRTPMGSGTAPDLSSAFHISIAWTLDKMTDLKQLSLGPSQRGDLDKIEILFDLVKLKVGNVVKDLPMSKSTT